MKHKEEFEIQNSVKRTHCFIHTDIDVMRLMEETAVLKVECKCGTKHMMPVWMHTAICRNCGKKIRNNTKEYFKYQARKKIKELEDTYDK